MGKIYGSNKFTGTVDGVRHYKIENNDDIIVSGSGGPTANQIKHNAAFERTRENMAEMTPRSKLASKIKFNLGQWSITVVNRYMIGAINAALRIAQKRNNDEKRGKRSIYLSACKDVLNNLTYYYYKAFAEIMKCRYSVEISADRRTLTIKLSNFNPNEQIKAPVEATHFQLCSSIGAVSDMVYSEDYERFAPVYDHIRMKHSIKEFEGPWIPIDRKAMGDSILSVTFPEDFILEDDMTVLSTFGIVFGKMTSEVEPLRRNRGSIVFLGAV